VPLAPSVENHLVDRSRIGIAINRGRTHVQSRSESIGPKSVLHTNCPTLDMNCSTTTRLIVVKNIPFYSKYPQVQHT
jgi:hypothetical protein